MRSILDWFKRLSILKKIGVIVGLFFLFIIVVATFSPTEETKPVVEEKPAVVEEKKIEEAPAAEETKPETKLTPEPQPIELSGIGQQATQRFTLEDGLSIFRMTHSGTSNFSIWLLDSNGEKVELLVNETGTFNGAKAVGISKRGEHVLDISADGQWTVKIEQPRPTMADSKPKIFTGVGQSVSPFIKLDKGLTVFKLKHTGKSNFATWLMDENGNREELLVNETGGFDGSKAVGIRQSGIYLMDISADGEWSISVE